MSRRACSGAAIYCAGGRPLQQCACAPVAGQHLKAGETTPPEAAAGAGRRAVRAGGQVGHGGNDDAVQIGRDKGHIGQRNQQAGAAFVAHATAMCRLSLCWPWHRAIS